MKKESTEQQSAVKTRVDPNRSLLGDAMGNAADTVGDWGSNALDTVVGVLPGVSHDHTPTKAPQDGNDTIPAPRQPQSIDLSTPPDADKDGWPDDVPKPPADPTEKRGTH